MTFRVLVVCAANVCRSPVGAEFVRRKLSSSSRADLIEVVSRGLSARDGEPICEAALALSGAEVHGHESALLTVDDVMAADLILTADVEQRGGVVRLYPPARRRAFTMLEAAVLSQWIAEGSPLPEGVEVMTGPPMPGDPVDRLAWWVVELNEGRGLPALGRQPEWDIPDAHGPDRANHSETVSRVVWACSTVGVALRELLD